MEYDLIKPLVHEKRREVDDLRGQLAKHPAPAPRRADVDAEVERALALFDQIDALAADEAARGALRQMFRRLNLNLWLSFGEGRKGSARCACLPAA